MIYREYGKTGKMVSALGMGGMRFQDQSDTEACAELVVAAHRGGVNYFDTAPGYGKSEELFGAAFRQMPKRDGENPFYVATKTFAPDADSFRADLENSLSRMGLDYIDFHHVWCLVTPDSWKERRKVLDSFEKARAEGLVRHICVSTHMDGADIAAMLADYPFEGVLLGYSAMNFAYREAGIAAAAATGKGVVVMNPLGGGMIPQFPERFAFVKSRPDESVVHGALRFLINDERISVVLVGLSDLSQLAEALAAVNGFQPIPAGIVGRIRDGLEEAFNKLCTSCGYCDDCPAGIPVPRLMEAFNHYVLTNSPQAAVNRLKWHWSIDSVDGIVGQCAACGRCEEACTQQLNILERLNQIPQFFDKV